MSSDSVVSKPLGTWGDHAFGENSFVNQGLNMATSPLGLIRGIMGNGGGAPDMASAGAAPSMGDTNMKTLRDQLGLQKKQASQRTSLTGGAGVSPAPVTASGVFGL